MRLFGKYSSISECRKLRETPLKLPRQESGSEARTGLADGLDYARLERLEFLLAQGAVMSLKSGADEQRIIVCAEPCIAKNFACAPLHKLGNLQRRERLINCFPRDTLIQNQRKIAAHGLKAGDVTRGRLEQGQPVEPVEIELADEDGIFELAGGGLIGM